MRPVHKRIRVGIWREIARLVKFGKSNFKVKRALEGYAHEQNFYKLIKRPELCAYFFTRPVDHNVEARILLDDSIENIRKIMRLELISEKGKVRPSVVNAHLKIYEMLQNRILGQTVQRIQQHTVQETKADSRKTVEQIDAELRALEQKDDSSASVIEVSEVD